MKNDSKCILSIDKLYHKNKNDKMIIICLVIYDLEINKSFKWFFSSL